MLFFAELSNPAAPAHVSRENPIPVASPPSCPQIVFCVITKLWGFEPVTLMNVPIESPSTVLHVDTTLLMVVVAPSGPPRNRSPSDSVPIFSAYPPLTESLETPSPAGPLTQCGFRLEFIRHMILVKLPPGR